MQRVSNSATMSLLRRAAIQKRTYVPGKIIKPEHVLNVAKMEYVRPSFIGNWMGTGLLSFIHLAPLYFGSVIFVFWCRGGFAGEIPPPS
eukprot:TRINITY_DN324_c0_g1_i2.p1 TRINITY_DN324_c0_g1~~TRINITY_DN324_c0_g1_i2.p1  ORF type:complete len:101 (+),score=24.63 TRINITY_DN324_c0_g1_i2:38-304(+)